VKTGYLNQKSESPERVSGVLSSESESARRQHNPLGKDTNDTNATAQTSPNQPPIYTVPKDTDEYHQRREKQYKDGLKTLLRSLLLFGILAAMWLALQHFIK